MKVSLWIEDGVKQIVLTPETKTETDILKEFGEGEKKEISTHWGSFYECQGGWVRQEGSSDRSAIIVIKNSNKE